jgi:tRNA uridine 5-carboxymethylaminomethyl modification enzyme
LAAQWQAFDARRSAVARTIEALRASRIGSITAFDHLRRPDVDWNTLAQTLNDARLSDTHPQIAFLVEIQAKYEAYIARQDKQIERFAKLEQKLIPQNLDYTKVPGLRNEARQKLIKFTPRSLGQALRISGITPADVTLLAVHLERK